MCVQIFHMVNIDVPVRVGAPPLDTTIAFECMLNHLHTVGEFVTYVVETFVL